MVNATLLSSFSEALDRDSSKSAKSELEVDKTKQCSKAKKSSDTDNSRTTTSERKRKMPRRKKKKVEDVELTEEELELRAKMKKLQSKKGVWEVSMNNGVVLGLYTGTPSKIGAYVCAQQQVEPKSLFFQLTKIREVPEVIARESCCERKFQRRDNFCPLCGAKRHLESKIPDSIQVEIYTDL